MILFMMQLLRSSSLNQFHSIIEGSPSAGADFAKGQRAKGPKGDYSVNFTVDSGGSYFL